MERVDVTRGGAASPALGRRDFLKLGGFVLAAGAAAPGIAACVGPSGDARSPASATDAGGPLAGSVTVLAIGGDPYAEPPLRKVYEDFRAQHPGVEWDIRALSSAGPEYDRLARAALAAGEPVSFLMINGQQLRGWVRDGLLADLGADPAMAAVLDRIPAALHFGGPGETTPRAVPLAASRGVHTTGLFYNRALLDEAGLEPPTTIAGMEAMVAPLARLGVAPLVHCSGDAFFNQVLVTWVLPMIAERTGDPIEFADRTVRGEIGYDSAEWVEALDTIANLRRAGVLLDGSGATDYATMQQLVLQGKVAMTFNGTWLLPSLLAGTPTGPFDLHVAPPPLVDGASRPRPILAWSGFALPATAASTRDVAYAFLEYASRPEVDRAVTAGTQQYSPMPASNDTIENEVAQEFLPMFDDAITPLDWLWEPEIIAELDRQVQALVKGETDATAAAKAVEAVADELRSTGRSYYS